MLIWFTTLLSYFEAPSSGCRNKECDIGSSSLYFGQWL
jgi:hypothetical protein